MYNSSIASEAVCWHGKLRQEKGRSIAVRKGEADTMVLVGEGVEAHSYAILYILYHDLMTPFCTKAKKPCLSGDRSNL